MAVYCALYVTGSVWYLGTVYPGYTRMIQNNWSLDRPIPPITFNSHPHPEYDYYNDGLGGIFSGSGWVGAPTYSLKACYEQGVDPEQPYDCLNGGCIPQTTYNTPGKYANLAACQAACAKDGTCDGECVSKDELAALQQAADQIRTRLCG
jgi:hypothetical protein